MNTKPRRVAPVLGALLLVPALLALQPATKKPDAKPAEKAAAPDKAANPAATPAPRQDDYWQKRNASFNDRAKQGAQKGDIDLLFMGDSITEGWEREGREVWAKSYAKRHAVNLGIGGDRTQHLMWRLLNGNVDGLDKPAAGHAPKLAVVMIGTNNTGDNTPEQIAGGVRAVLDSIHTKLPTTKVLLLAIFPRAEKPSDLLRKKVADTNQLISKFDGGNVTYLDIGSQFVEKNGTISKEIMPDFLHLSPKGYQLWADAIESKVHQLMAEP